MRLKLNNNKMLFFLSIVFLFCSICLFISSFFVYKPDFNFKYLKLYESNYLNFVENRKYIFMQPKNVKDINECVVFYPGGLVDERAYLPLLSELAKEGFGVYILKSFFKLPILNYNSAEEIILENKFDKYTLMGHSLGGTALLKYFSTQSELTKKIGNIILLASYSDGKFDFKQNDLVKILSIVGSNDGVIDFERSNEDRNNFLEDNFSHVSLEGGNHSYFGNYGEQAGDNKGDISREEQQYLVLNIIKQFLNESKIN